ncbi:hypothetical protein K3495_g8208 [Podosphaera aphanis]|nr:hypothetical protein K3495_g8208 [Podosphaera aphanis]
MEKIETPHKVGNKDVQDPNEVVEKYFLGNANEYQLLHKLKLLGWSSEKGDEYFKKQRSAADHPKKGLKKVFFSMMRQIGDELHKNTSALTPDSLGNEGIQVLDICMASGGFSSTVLKVYDNARICGITLPRSQNGYDILLPNWKNDPRLVVYFGDITMLVTEMGGVAIPPGHPDAANFLTDRPFCGKKFDLIFCDGQVLRTHPRPDYREMREPWRLITSQLVLALTRVKTNGTLVMLLHNLDTWETLSLVYTLNKFSSIMLFKPGKCYAKKSSFYVVAKKIQTQGPEINAAIEIWKKEWQVATFGTESEYNEFRRRNDHLTSDVLRDFGDKVISLAEPIWRIQSSALNKASFMPKAEGDELTQAKR